MRPARRREAPSEVDEGVLPTFVIPAKAGIQVFGERRVLADADGPSAPKPEFRHLGGLA